MPRLRFEPVLSFFTALAVTAALGLTACAPAAPAPAAPGSTRAAEPTAAPDAQAPSTSTAAPDGSTPDGEALASADLHPSALGQTDGGAPTQFRACQVDADCEAVDRVGCCHNGWQEAVATSQKDAYEQSFTCPQPHPICPMYIVRDTRVAECDNASHLCTMVAPEQIACGGFLRNPHNCPAGYRCRRSKIADVPGKCTKP